MQNRSKMKRPMDHVTEVFSPFFCYVTKLIPIYIKTYRNLNTKKWAPVVQRMPFVVYVVDAN